MDHVSVYLIPPQEKCALPSSYGLIWVTSRGIAVKGKLQSAGRLMKGALTYSLAVVVI